VEDVSLFPQQQPDHIQRVLRIVDSAALSSAMTSQIHNFTGNLALVEEVLERR
jgi:hypothetical protein